jgi:hypothetical protein
MCLTCENTIKYGPDRQPEKPERDLWTGKMRPVKKPKVVKCPHCRQVNSSTAMRQQALAFARTYGVDTSQPMMHAMMHGDLTDFRPQSEESFKRTISEFDDAVQQAKTRPFEELSEDVKDKLKAIRGSALYAQLCG